MDIAYIAQVVINGILIGGVYALIAIGLSLIWGVMEIVNFAHGDFLMAGAFFSFMFWSYFGLDPLFSLPLIFCIFLLIGFGTQKFVMKRLMDAPTLLTITATFALSLIIRYGFFVVFKPNYRVIESPIVEGTLHFGSVSIPIAKTVSLIIALITILLLFLFLKYTKKGRAIRATAQDRDVAKSLGVNVDHMFLLTWGLGIGCVAIAGTMLSTFYYVFPLMGVAFVTIAFASVTLGGFGSIHGAVFGGLIIGLVEQFGAALMSPALKHAFVFIIFILVLIFRPMGFFGKY
jgi:branched-chain amino acid transport system permease protein